jgi:hypothetical protein
MTVQELLEILEEMVENGAGHYEVKLLLQPNYPFIYTVGSVGVREIEDEFGEFLEEEVLYLTEGRQESYGFKEEELRNLRF